jgi:hypothetical protein
MMQYFVCQISAAMTLGTMTQHESEEAAIEHVKQIVVENGVELTPEVLEEINNDLGYVQEDMEWSVQIGIVG